MLKVMTRGAGGGASAMFKEMAEAKGRQPCSK